MTNTIKLNTKDLNTTLNTLKKVLGVKANKNCCIYSNHFLFDKCNQKLQITIKDAELNQLSQSILIIESIGSDFSFSIDIQYITSILKLIKSDTIEFLFNTEIKEFSIKYDDKNILINKVNFTPFLRVVEEQTKDTIISYYDTAALIQGVQRTVNTSSTDPMRACLNSILIESKDNKIQFTSTDAFSISHIEYDIKHNCNTIESIVLTSQFAKILSKMAQEIDAIIIEMRITNNVIEIKNENFVLVGNFNSGKFGVQYPKYSNVIPPKADNLIVIEKDKLLKELTLAEQIMGKDNKDIALLVTENKLTIYALDCDSNIIITHTTINCEYDGNSILSFYKIKQLRNIIKDFNKYTTSLILSIINEDTPIVINPNNGINNEYSLLMPTHIESVKLKEILTIKTNNN